MKLVCHQDICITIFIAALFKISKRWKPPKYPPMDGWTKKLWCVYPMKYYSAIMEE
jgi:hypothetical protein